MPNSGGVIRYPRDPDLGPDFRCVQREFDVSNGASIGRNSLQGKGRSEDELWLVDVGARLQQAALNFHLHHDILCISGRKSGAAPFDSASRINPRERCWRFDVQICYARFAIERLIPEESSVIPETQI
ncbi:hypothetical protein X801_05629 [Opisthorchis viverrini]|uniref:Uncharacterized protein n=1 Tax=Opisthorchis viverrini TaxID=6198 RepID=A0A1S8WVY7_OPIVI|nr:hypothetical protein X801_05629 [Opisthorchis viverrini]